MTPRDPHAADRAVSKALDHFQNRYYELHKAAAEVVSVYGVAGVSSEVDIARMHTAIAELREKLKP